MKSSSSESSWEISNEDSSLASASFTTSTGLILLMAVDLLKIEVLRIGALLMIEISFWSSKISLLFSALFVYEPLAII